MMATKRKMDDSFGAAKRRTMNWNDIQIGGDIIFVKCLIPTPVAGLVIGKGGETIEKLQTEIGMRIRLSKSDDLYPGTNDRVCIMKGTIEQLTQFIRTYYMDNLLAIEAREHKMQRMDQPNDRYEFKMIVPVETVGRIIGNSGAVVKEIIKKTKAFIQVSQRPPTHISLPERVMKVAGDIEPIMAAVKEILTRFQEDPNHADHLFVSYGQAEYAPNAFPAGPAVAQVDGSAGEAVNPYQTQTRGMNPSQGKYNGAGYGAAAGASGSDEEVRLLIAHDKTPVDNDLLRNYMVEFNQQLQVLGCPPAAMQEIIYAVDTLAKYHLLSMTGGKSAKSGQSPLWTAPGQSVGYNASMYSKAPPPVASQQQKSYDAPSAYGGAAGYGGAGSYGSQRQGGGGY